MKRLLLVVNPVAGKGKGMKKYPKAMEIFSERGYEPELLLTDAKGEAAKRITEVAADFDMIVAIGGDGTLNMVADAVIKSGSDTPMGYIPLGSTNDFGASLELSKNIKRACINIVSKEPKPIDVGCINGVNFVYIACTGLFTSSSYSTPQKMKRIFGKTAYLFKGFADLFRAESIHYSISIDGDEDIEGDFLYGGISNTLRVAGIFSLKTSNVVFDDGIFELTMIKTPERKRKIPSLLFDIAFSRLYTDNFRRAKLKRAVIRCEKPKCWSIDGEKGEERVESVIEVKEKALRFIY